MALPIKFNPENALIQVDDILQTNDISKKHGLVLTLTEAEEIISVRNQVLRKHGRIELSSAVSGKLIQSFCSSSFINQVEYVLIIHELHEIFYYYKNRTKDKIGDRELIAIMSDYYENCGGSMELMKDKLESLAGEL